LKFDI